MSETPVSKNSFSIPPVPVRNCSRRLVLSTHCCRVTKPRSGWGWQVPVEFTYSIPAQSMVSYSRWPRVMSCQVWMSPRMETPQLLWASTWQPLHWRYIFWFLSGISCVSVCPQGHCWEETGPIFFTTPSLKYLYTLMSSLLQAKHSQLSQCMLVHQVLESLKHFNGPSLDKRYYFQVFLILGSPELGTALRMCPSSAEQRGRIPSLNLLAMCHLAQPRPGSGWAFSAKLLSRHSAPSLSCSRPLVWGNI